MFNNIRIVLISTTHPGNIGSAARALKNMGLERLYLVSPRALPDAESFALAAGGADLLGKTVICHSLLEAIGDCSVVYGSGSDLRNEPWPVINAREAAEKMMTEDKSEEIAIVFGRESSGMTNDEMKHCHYQVQISGGSAYCSLNLAQAVQVMTYELRMAYHNFFEPSNTLSQNKEKASIAEFENVFNHLEKTLLNIKALDSKQPGQLMNRMRRILNKAALDKKDIAILHGILSVIDRL